MAKGRTTQWIDPNGDRHTRTSQTMTYTHLIVVRRDEQLYAMDQLSRAYALESRAQLIRDLIEDPQPPELKYPGRLYRYPADVRRTGRSGQWHSVLWRDRDVADRNAWSDECPYYQLPDWQSQQWDLYIDGVLERMDVSATEARLKAEEAAGSRRTYSYAGHGWSQSPVNAEKKRRDVEKYMTGRYHEVMVVEVSEA